MLFDAFTIGAQIVNFLILVVLLRRFLYRPIVKAIKEREQRIAAQIARAEETQRQAEQQAAQLRQETLALAARRAELMQQAQDEVEAWRQEQLLRARAQVDATAARWQHAIEQQQEAFLRDAGERITRETFRITRRALADLADASLEQQISQVFLARLRALNETHRAAFARAAQDAKQPLRVQSAFELPPSQREQIVQVVHETIRPDAPVKFEHAPELIAGIELRANDYRICWSFARYVDSLQKELGELVKA